MNAVFRFIARAVSTMLGTGRTMGTQVLVVIPWRAGVTPRNIEVWQGRVEDGTTLCALNVYAPRAIKESMLGVCACWMPSGRQPSMTTRIAPQVEESLIGRSA